MTGRQILDGFGRLQKRFPGRKYKGGDLNPVWAELLQCSVEAFERAIGIMLKNGRYLPEPGYVLERTLYWEKMVVGPVELASRDLDTEAEARESLRLTREMIQGDITEEEYIAGLYAMSERYGKAEYAEAARNRERRRA